MNQTLIAEFKSAGCPSDKEATIALQVYLELCEVKRYWNVEWKWNEAQKILYFTANKSKDEETSVFIPLSAGDGLTFSKMEALCQLADADPKNVFLALVSPDSTCVYYQMTSGLVEPTESTAKHLRENRQEIIDNEVRKNRKALEEAAMYGFSITIPQQNKNTPSHS